MSQRIVTPELLDHLPVDDPGAIRSRRDLRLVNRLMGNGSWICRTLRSFPEITNRSIVEIGAGDGTLCNRLARLFPDAPVSAYDLAPTPPDLDPRVAWHCGDVFALPTPPPGGVVLANLFLHHFEDDDLARLGRWMSGFDAMVFSEPDRAILPHVWGTVMHPLLNYVTRHDLHASIRAGFTEGEITRFLRLEADRWRTREFSTWLGARRMIVCHT